MFLMGDVPSGCQPHFEWRPGFVKNGSRCHTGWVLATLTNQAIAAGLDSATNNAALRTDELLGPMQPVADDFHSSMQFAIQGAK